MYQSFVAAVYSRDVQRIASIIHIARRRGFGLKRMVGILRANRTRYTERECATAVVLYRVGSPTAKKIFHAANSLPSVCHTQRLAARITQRVIHQLCVRNADQACEELQKAPVKVHFDEISIVQRLVLGPDDEFLGLCEHAPRVCFKSMSDLAPILTNVQNGTWHIAKHARVVSVSRHSDRNYAAAPIACIASCNQFTSEEARAQIEKVGNLWDELKDEVGPVMSYATDGDARRRKALNEMVQAESNILGCPVVQYLCTKEGATICKDQRHITKRCTRKVCSGTALEIAGVAISMTVPIGLAAKLGTSKEISGAAKETDSMSVVNALRIIRGIVDIAEANHTALDSSRHGQASAVKGMHWFLRHTDDYYYANYRSLQDRLTSAAAAAIHLYLLQQERNSFSKALYMDMQCEHSGVFADIEFKQKHCPTCQYFICLRGNDRIETLFSIVRTARGTGGVLHILQLRHRLDIATQLEELFALDPKSCINRKCARYGDNMTPATAGPCYVADVDLCKAWLDGWARAERKLGIAIDLNEGFGLLSPHGTILEVDNKDLQEDDRIG